MKYTGELAALAASLGWAGSALFFEFGTRRIGSRFVNAWRLLWALLLIGGINLIFYPSFFREFREMDVLWLLASGFVGFFLGDILLFWSFAVIGSRLSLLIMLANPFVSALAGWYFWSEKLTFLQIMAMVGLVGCVALILSLHYREEKTEKVSIRRYWLGILAAIGGMFGQAGGALLAKPVVSHVSFIFAATFMRVIGGLVSFLLLIVLRGEWKKWLASFQQKDALLATVGGSVFGPVVGVSLFLFSMARCPLGVATTLSSLAPIVLLVVDILRGKKFHWLEFPLTAGAVVFLMLFFR